MVGNIKCDIIAEESEEESQTSNKEQSEGTVPVITPTNDRNDSVDIDTVTDDMESDNDV